jgi:mitochondrial translocator assembly and maintenance protein 41
MEVALGRILSLLPSELSLCFAYGSGVLRQAGTSSKVPRVLDLVVVAPNTLLFHDENLRRNHRHYSSWRWLGASAVARLQEAGSAGVYYNTLLPLPMEPGRLFKYGVVSTPTLEADLLDWRALYLAGRLHKPVALLEGPKGPDGVRLAQAMRTNLHSALHAALLLLPESFTGERFCAFFVREQFY